MLSARFSPRFHTIPIWLYRLHNVPIEFIELQLMMMGDWSSAVNDHLVFTLFIAYISQAVSGIHEYIYD